MFRKTQTGLTKKASTQLAQAVDTSASDLVNAKKKMARLHGDRLVRDFNVIFPASRFDKEKRPGCNQRVEEPFPKRPRTLCEPDAVNEIRSQQRSCENEPGASNAFG